MMMKHSIKWLLISLFILLSGCSNEPMIKLSEENQVKLEEKRQQSKAIVEESQIDESQISTSISQSQEEGTVAEIDQYVTSTFDPSGWTHLPDETILEMSNYLPFYPYQLKQFNNETGIYTTYADYFDETNQVMQVHEIIGTDTFINIYRWDETQIQLTLREEAVALFENMLEAGQQTFEDTLTLLSAPLTVGTTWSYDGTHQSEILALYDQVTLGELTFSQVIEISTQFEAYDLRQYYAAEEGLIGTRYITSNDANETEEFWQVTSSAHQVMMIVNQSIAQPRIDDNSLLALETVPFAFQTNDTMARAFQRLFIEQEWITSEIVINSITVDELGVATIDFSSGVVAAFNQHPSKEAGVIPAIVTTVGQFLDVNQVRLTVNNNGLLPDTLPYPPNGIYEVDTSWLGN